MTEWLTENWSSLRTNNYAQAITLLVGSLIAAKLIDWLVTGAITRWAKTTRTTIDDQLIALLHRPVFLSVILFGLWASVQRLELAATPELFLLRFIKTLAILLWLGFALRASSVLLQLASKLGSQAAILQKRTLHLFDNLAKVGIFVGGVYLLCLSWGVDLTGWVAATGIVGLAVGFAAKDTLANLFAGVFILADAPYKIGDFIVLDSGERGQVTQIGLRSTRLLTRDDIEITVPNAVIGQAKITNESGGPWKKERIRIKVGVAYGSDVDQVRQVLLEIAATHEEFCNEPEPRVRFRAFGDSGLEFELLGWIEEPALRGRLTDELNTEIYKHFMAEQIEIPYPKRDVYVRELPPSTSSASSD